MSYYISDNLGANLSSASRTPSPLHPDTVIVASDLTASEALPKAILVFATLNKGTSVALSPIAITSSFKISLFL
jgi:hypothetical protein